MLNTIWDQNKVIVDTPHQLGQVQADFNRLLAETTLGLQGDTLRLSPRALVICHVGGLANGPHSIGATETMPSDPSWSPVEQIMFATRYVGMLGAYPVLCDTTLPDGHAAVDRAGEMVAQIVVQNESYGS